MSRLRIACNAVNLTAMLVGLAVASAYGVAGWGLIAMSGAFVVSHLAGYFEGRLKGLGL